MGFFFGGGRVGRSNYSKMILTQVNQCFKFNNPCSQGVATDPLNLRAYLPELLTLIAATSINPPPTKKKSLSGLIKKLTITFV